MKITEEFLRERIDEKRREKAFCVERGMEILAEMVEGEIMAYTDVLFMKKMSGARLSIGVLNKSVPKWKRKLIRFLDGIIDRLEGVEK